MRVWSEQALRGRSCLALGTVGTSQEQQSGSLTELSVIPSLGLIISCLSPGRPDNFALPFNLLLQSGHLRPPPPPLASFHPPFGFHKQVRLFPKVCLHQPLFYFHQTSFQTFLLKWPQLQDDGMNCLMEQHSSGIITSTASDPSPAGGLVSTVT